MNLRLQGLYKTRPIGVALSGGADSVALLAALTAEGYHCVALHCNFHLRGDESNRDEAHARTIAERLGAPILVKDFDVAAHQHATGQSVEMAARELRYNWFESTAKEHDLQAVAIAHNSDDQAETFLLNLMRGSGVKGLKGMSYRRGIFVRPMLEVSRHEIEDYLGERGLDYVTDSTNLSTDYHRNLIRHKVLPAMEEHLPGITRAILRSMEVLGMQNEIIERIVADTDEGDHRGLSLGARLGEDSLRPIVAERLARHGFSAATIKEILGQEHQNGAIFTSATEGTFVLHDGNLLPLPEEDWREVEVDLSKDGENDIIKWEIVPRESIKSLRVTPDTLLLDADTAPSTAILRHWREGDRIAPFGMRGTRLVSDLLSDAHLPLPAKRSLWLLATPSSILWVASLRASRHHPITPATTRVLRIHLK
ncbi:MAG: tRNA lysidine(34) synthetase TilS [Bacteroidales bacterium]|nr:tRNA lysidine(34) synthetase TilS [Bacteroidales bacterium]